MKTQEEIVTQAKAYAEFIGNEDGTSAFDYIMGYNNCQQDMADKKYTEDDIKEAAYFFVSKKLAANQGILDEEIQDFINSLNKQD